MFKNKNLFHKESLINLFFFFWEVFLTDQGKEYTFNETWPGNKRMISVNSHQMDIALARGMGTFFFFLNKMQW